MCVCVCSYVQKTHVKSPSLFYICSLRDGGKVGDGIRKRLGTIAKDQLWISFQVLKMSNYKVTKGSSSGATLSLALRSKGDAGQPSYLIFFRRLLFISGPATPSQTLKSDPKHCNLYTLFLWLFSWKKLLATCRKLRKYQCFCSVLSKKHCKYRGFLLAEETTS